MDAIELTERAQELNERIGDILDALINEEGLSEEALVKLNLLNSVTFEQFVNISSLKHQLRKDKEGENNEK